MVNTQKKSGRGSVGRMTRQRKRYATDEEFRNKRRAEVKKWGSKNKERISKRERERSKKLSEFRNRRCNECNKLLHWRTKGEYCKNHIQIGVKKKKGLIPRIIFNEKIVRDSNMVKNICLDFLEKVFGEGEVEIIRK
jgi:hypothetical protein